MPDFQPFTGVRYDPPAAGTTLDLLVAPPYDVIDEPQRAALEAAHPCNSVRLVLPRDGDVDGDRYDRAAETFAAWTEAGLLRRDPGPRFYAYRMDFRSRHGTARHTLGVLGALTLPEPGDGTVLPHEKTLPKARSDRLALLRATRVNLDPIWALSPTGGLTGLLAPAGSPLASCTDSDGVTHTVWAIDAPDRVAAVSEAVGREPLVIADGHHRFETACNYRRELHDARRPVGGAGAIMAFVVELDDDELDIRPIHRVLKVPDPAGLRACLREAFEIVPAGAARPEAVEALADAMVERGALGLVDGEGLALLVPRPEVCDPARAGQPPEVADTDAALVEAVVVPRCPEVTWAYRHDATAVAGLVADGGVDAALLLRPVSVGQTRAAARAGVRMPQKTTFFHPKPRTGIVFRPLDGPA